METKSEIKTTRDLNQFKKLVGNRNLNDNHIRQLTESIKKQNLLFLRPILINESFEVLDGQHRLEAAKILNVEISYLMVSSSGNTQIARLNTNQKNWKIRDYLNLYIDGFHNENYKNLNNFCITYGFDLNIAFTFLGYNIKKMSLKEEFQNGEYKFPEDLEEIRDKISKFTFVSNLIKKHEIKPNNFQDSIIFLHAFLSLINSKKINWDVFCNKIEHNWIRLGKRYNYDQYLEMFLEIYNSNSPYKILINEL